MLSAVFCWNVPDLCSTSVIRDLIRSFTILSPGGSPPFWGLCFVLRAVPSPLETWLEGPFLPFPGYCLEGEGGTGLVVCSCFCCGRILPCHSCQDLSPRQSRLIILCRDLFLIKSLRDFAGDLDEVFFSVLLGAWGSIWRRLRSLLKGLLTSLCHLDVAWELSLRTPSFFLRDTISGSSVLGFLKVLTLWAYSFRGSGSSLAFFRNWSVADVLKAASCVRTRSLPLFQLFLRNTDLLVLLFSRGRTSTHYYCDLVGHSVLLYHVFLYCKWFA